MDFQQLAIQYFDKALLGVAFVWLLLTGVGMTSTPAELKKKTQLQEIRDQVEEYVGNHKAKKLPVADWKSDVEANLKAERVEQINKFPEWSMHNRPNLIFSFITTTITQEPVHEQPVDVSVRPERGRITLSWSENSSNVLVKIKEYVIERSDNDEPFKSVATLDADTTEFVDTSVKPRSQYKYRVISNAGLDVDHPQVQRMLLKKLIKPELSKNMKTKVSAESNQVTMPRITVVVPKGIIKPSVDEEIAAREAGRIVPYKATIRVYRWDPDIEGNWVYQDFFQVRNGSKIGRKMKKKGKEIDFGIGTLVDCQIKKDTDPNDKTRQIEWLIVTIKYPDGTTESFNNVQVPEEIKALK